MDITPLMNLFRRKYRKGFGFACFFGSLKRDVDFFVIPDKNTKKGFFIKTLVLFLEEIRNELKKENIDLLVIPHSTFEEEIKYINIRKNEKKTNILHISSFPDIHPVPIKDLLPSLKKANLILTGNYKAINEMKKTKFDYYYNYLFIANCLMSNYPKKLEKEKIFNKVSYIYKYLTGKRKKLRGKPEKIFFDCCDFLDKCAY